MCKQLSLLPLTHQFDKNGYLDHTTYYETDLCKENAYYLVVNKKNYTMLLPEDNFDWMGEIVEAQTAVITKGSYNGKKDCIEIMFQDNIEHPYSIILSNEQVECVTPLKEGWGGKLYIYTGGLYNCRNWFYYVYYRVADTLPYGKPIKLPEEVWAANPDRFRVDWNPFQRNE
jgi:hypothetical protein